MLQNLVQLPLFTYLSGDKITGMACTERTY